MIKEIPIEMDISGGGTLSFVVFGKLFERMIIHGENGYDRSGDSWWESDYNQHLLLTKEILDKARFSNLW